MSRHPNKNRFQINLIRKDVLLDSVCRATKVGAVNFALKEFRSRTCDKVQVWDRKPIPGIGAPYLVFEIYIFGEVAPGSLVR